jgi:hypothetical protein
MLRKRWMPTVLRSANLKATSRGLNFSMYNETQRGHRCTFQTRFSMSSSPSRRVRPRPTQAFNQTSGPRQSRTTPTQPNLSTSP